jgi:branched-chain amino acid transport system substrate-binding protein
MKMSFSHSSFSKNGILQRGMKSLILFGMIALFQVSVTPNLFAQETVKVGALIPFSGGLSIMGKTAQAALDTAESNVERLFFDMDIEIIAEDTETNPDVALEKIKILHDQGIKVIIGPFSSSCVEKIKPFADENHILIISPTSTSPSLAEDDMIFRMHLNDNYKAAAVAEFMQQQDYQSVALLYRDDTYGNEYASAFKPLWSDLGGTIFGEVKYSVDQSDFTDTVQQLNQIVQDNVGSASQTVVLTISYEEIGDIAKAASQHEALSQVKWIENESASHIDAFLNDADVKNFALQTEFTFASIAAQELYHPYYPHVPKCENLLTQIYESTNEKLQEDIIFYVYDSFQVGCFAALLVDFMDTKESFIELSHELFGISSFLIFDENGDRSNGATGFHRFMESDGQAGWGLVATYRTPQPPFELYVPYSYYEYPPIYTDRSVKIGALLSLTGDNASMGLQMQKTLDMAGSDLTKYLKRQFTENSSIEIVSVDTASDPQVALDKIQELHSQGVELFIGPLTSSELHSVANYANDNGLILLSPSSTSLDLAIDDSIFRLALDNGKMANALAEYLKDVGIEFVQTVYRDDIYGADLYTVFKEKFEAIGGTCAEGVSYSVDTTDFSETVDFITDGIASAAAIHETTNTAVLAIALDEAVNLFNVIPEDSILREVRWFGGDGLSQNSSIANDPSAYSFALATDFTTFSPGNTSYDIFGMFERSWRNVLRDFIGSTPAAYDYMAYDAAWFLTMLSVKEDYAEREFDRNGILVELVNHAQGPFQFYTFNSSGDSQYGYTDFYRLRDGTNGAYWSTTAKYSYQFNGETLYNFDPVSDTAVMEWSLY